MIRFPRLGTPSHRQLGDSLAVSLVVISLCGFVATAVATEHEPPVVPVDEPAVRIVDDVSSDDASRGATVEPPPLAEMAVEPPVATPVPLQLFEAPAQTLTIPAIRVNAPLVAMGVGRDGYMALPYNAYQVACSNDYC